MKPWHWILIIGILIVGLFLGGWINAKTDLFGFLGFTGAADIRAAGDRVADLIGKLEERDKLYAELSGEYQRRVEHDKAFYEKSLAEERSRADSLAGQNRILRDGIESIGRGESKTGDALQSAERIWKLIDGIEKGIQRLQDKCGDGN